MRAGFPRFRQAKHDVGGLAERAFGIDRDRDEHDAETARIIDQVLQFLGLAGPGQRQHDVVRRDHAEVAMAGVGGMNEECRRPGRGQRRRDLARDVAGFAHAGDDHPAACRAYRFDGGDERRSQSVGHRRGERRHALGFGIERAQRRGNVGIDARASASSRRMNSSSHVSPLSTPAFRSTPLTAEAEITGALISPKPRTHRRKRDRRAGPFPSPGWRGRRYYRRSECRTTADL